MGEPSFLQDLPVRLGRWAVTASPRIRLVSWLLMFLCAYRVGLPILYSAALAALPWMLLPREPKG